MDLEKIQFFIRNGETETIEYKKSFAELEKLGKSLCAQLNANGGYGFIGITDAGKLIGTEINDSTKKKLTAFKDYFDPWPNIEINYINLNDSKYIIAFSCTTSSQDGPFTFKGKPYLKTPSGIKAMPSEKYKRLLLNHAGISKAWESLVANGITLNDLDHEEIIKTFNIGIREGRIPQDESTENVAEILTHFDLMEDDELNNAAAILYAKKIPADYSQCFIRMGRFIDDTMDDVLDSRQIRGNAFQILTEATEFVKRHLPISSRFAANQLERIDEMAIPFLAIREALINAICHRDYSSRAGDIALYIFNDHMEIHNIGHLYGGLTIEQFSSKHPSRRRNERIAQVFHARKLIDRFGGGTRRILRLCAEQNLPTPIFSEDSDGFLVKFFYKDSIGPQKESTFIAPELTDRQHEILKCLASYGALTTKELHGKLTSPPSERWLRDELNGLTLLGLVLSEGATTKKKWILFNR